MTDAKSRALEVAKEITIAALQGCTNQVNCNLGDYAAKYFEEVYNKVYELATDSERE